MFMNKFLSLVILVIGLLSSVLGIFGILGKTDVLEIFGNQYDKSFDEDFPKGIKFGMSEEEIARVEGYDYTRYERDNGESFMHYDSNDDHWIFSLSNNKLKSIYIAMPEEYAWRRLEKYGEADEVTRFGNYYWYGTVGDTKCVLGYEWGRVSGPGMTFEAR